MVKGDIIDKQGSGNLIIDPAGVRYLETDAPTGMPYQVEPFYFKWIINYLNFMATRAIAKTIIHTTTHMSFVRLRGS
jgi:hypothetical protein